MSRDEALRDHVLELLRGGHAHPTFADAVDELPAELRGERAEGIPHTPWRLVEHLRLCQWDILQYCVDPDHVSPDFPDGYWPAEDGPPTATAWDTAIESFEADFAAMEALVADPHVDLLEPIPHGDGEHTILREALLVADHNAYHVGQLVAVRRALGAWPED